MTNTKTDSDPDDELHAHIVLDFLGDALDPAPLVALIPFKHGRPRKKGDLMTNRPSTSGLPVARAKTGVVCFSTLDETALTDGDAHLRFLLDIFEERLPTIKDLIASQSLTWTAWFFEGDFEGQYFTDLSTELVERAARIGCRFCGSLIGIPRTTIRHQLRRDLAPRKAWILGHRRG